MFNLTQLFIFRYKEKKNMDLILDDIRRLIVRPEMIKAGQFINN